MGASVNWEVCWQFQEIGVPFGVIESCNKRLGASQTQGGYPMNVEVNNNWHNLWKTFVL